MRALLLTVFLVLATASVAHADVVYGCDHAWERGMQGHGMSCETNWPALGLGGLGCAACAGTLIALLLFAARPTAAGRTRGD
jgi:hypothetical protein